MEALRETSVPVPLPPAMERERGPVLQRALRGLPLDLLEPLVDGLRRHADSLAPGSLDKGDGEGCAIGMMLREIAADPERRARGELPPEEHKPRWHRPRPSVYHRWPELAKRYPRLQHLETIFDSTCHHLVRRSSLPAGEVPRSVGLWMAAETESEINLRHLESAGQVSGAGAREHTGLDERLFSETVDRLMELRPALKREEAMAAVEAVVGGRPQATFEREVVLQRERLRERSPALV